MQKVINSIKTTEEYKEVLRAGSELEVLVSKDEVDVKAVAEKEVEIKNSLNALNAKVKELYFDEIFASAETPEGKVLKAIELGSFSLYGSKLTKENKFEVTSKMYIVDLMELEEASASPLLKNGQAFNWIEKLNHSIFQLNVGKMGIKTFPKEYKPSQISKVAKALELESLDSKTSNVKALQKVVDGIVFVETKDAKGKVVNQFKVDSRDLNALLLNYSRFSSATLHGVRFPNKEVFRVMFMRILNRVVTGKDYVAE